MGLQVIGAGLPRTGTASLKQALEHLLGGPCYHMREIPGHPFELGPEWDRALAGETLDWDRLLEGYRAGVDWPVAMFWGELSEAYPQALVMLQVRDSARTWLRSIERTILPVARTALEPGWEGGYGLVELFERFAGTGRWDEADTLAAAYERHNARVREALPPHRLLEWRVEEGWEPICRALDLPVPAMPFPWINKREDWEQ